MSITDFGRFYNDLVDPPLWLATSAHGDDRGGLIATFVSNASLAPEEPRVIVGIAKHHFTWRLIERSRAFCLHLVEEKQVEWVRCFGLSSGHEGDKFVGLNPMIGANGCPLFTDSIFWAECTVEAAFDTGDRSLFLGRIAKCGQGIGGRSLTMSALSKTLNARDRDENDQRLARHIAIDTAAIREWRSRLGELHDTDPSLPHS